MQTNALKYVVLSAVTALSFSISARADHGHLRNHPHLEAAYFSVEHADREYSREPEHRERHRDEAILHLDQAERELNQARGDFGGHRNFAKREVAEARRAMRLNYSHWDVRKILEAAKLQIEEAALYADEHH